MDIKFTKEELLVLKQLVLRGSVPGELAKYVVSILEKLERLEQCEPHK
ncbi:MAG: hypothetical protein ABIL14_01305 [candidate division WOR-3 bacterium]